MAASPIEEAAARARQATRDVDAPRQRTTLSQREEPVRILAIERPVESAREADFTP